MRPILVLDFGSSALKAVLFGPDGGVSGEAQEGYATASPQPGWQEQAPQDWWAALVRAVATLNRTVGPVHPAAIALVGTMENTILLDAAGSPIRPALLYSDGRAESAFAALAPQLAARDAARRLGNAPDAFMTLFKLCWLRTHEPEAMRRAALVLPGSKDYIGLRLTEVAATDATNATTTGLMDLATRDWADDMLALAGLDRRQLPPIRPAAAVLGHVSAQAAMETGLPAGTPVVNGCGDAAASTLGAGAGAPGQAYVYLGTTGWVARSTHFDAGRLPRPFYSLAHPQAGLVVEIAAILSAGDCAAWFGRLTGRALDDLEAAAQAADTAPPDTLFLPYLKGERCPFVDPRIRGAFIGLDAGHGPAELHYAVLEGVALAIRNNLDALGDRPATLRLLGGGGGSTLWPQLIADATGCTVEVSDLPTAATAAGAYGLACAALGGEGAAPAAGQTRRHAARPERVERVERRLGLFRRLTDALRGPALSSP